MKAKQFVFSFEKGNGKDKKLLGGKVLLILKEGLHLFFIFRG